MIGRFFWVLIGAAAIFAWWHWDEIMGIVENRKAIGAGAKAYNAFGDLIDAGKTIYHEVVE
jgi:hypothetical protein